MFTLWWLFAWARPKKHENDVQETEEATRSLNTSTRSRNTENGSSSESSFWLRVITWSVVATGVSVSVFHIALGVYYTSAAPSMMSSANKGLVADNGAKYHLPFLFVTVASMAVTFMFLGPENLRVALLFKDGAAKAAGEVAGDQGLEVETSAAVDHEETRADKNGGLASEDDHEDYNGQSACGKFWCGAFCSGSCTSIYLVLILLFAVVVLLPGGLLFLLESRDDASKILQVKVNLDLGLQKTQR